MPETPYHPKANEIHSTALVHPSAILGTGNVIGPGVIIEKNVQIGDNNYIGAYTTVGTPGECRDRRLLPKGKVLIGNGNIIREYVSIQSPVRSEMTVVGDDNYIMNKTHIAHDCRLGDHINMAPFTSLGGCVTVEDHANFGQGVIVHPRLTIGESTMLGCNATIVSDVPAYQTWVNNSKANQIGWNVHGLTRQGYTAEQINKLTK